MISTMASKPQEAPKPKKEKRVLTEEEKIAKEQHAALVAEETRKKVVRDRRVAIKQAMIKEEKRSKLTMLQMHKTWRSIMREQSVQELRKDMQWMSEKHVHEVELKDRVICAFYKQLEESENQHQEAMRRHFNMMDNMVATHDVRKQQMEDNFQMQLDSLNKSFFTEREAMTKQNDELKKDIAKTIKSMKEYFDDDLNDQRQEYEIVLEDVKNKNKEDYNVLQIQAEAKIEQMEHDIDKTHQDYLKKTKGIEEEYKLLQKKDRITCRTIEKRMQELIAFHNRTVYMKSALVIKGKEWDDANKNVSDEKWKLNSHFIKLQRFLGNFEVKEHENLKRTSASVHEATEALKKFLIFVRKLQTLARLNQKLETKHEQVFPFNPLHVASIPTAPLQCLDEELAEAAKDDKYGGLNEDVPTFHWSSYAVDDNGNEVAELHYLRNFQTRYNKVMLDKLALQLERREPLAANEKLQGAMGKWLDGYTFTDKAKARANSLMGVNRCKMKPRPPTKSTLFINIPK